MLAHSEIVRPPALTVHQMEAANARAKRLGEAPIFARVRRRTAGGSLVFRWVRLAHPGTQSVGGGAVVTTPPPLATGVNPATGATTTGPTLPPETPVVVGGLENGTPVR